MRACDHIQGPGSKGWRGAALAGLLSLVACEGQVTRTYAEAIDGYDPPNQSGLSFSEEDAADDTAGALAADGALSPPAQDDAGPGAADAGALADAAPAAASDAGALPGVGEPCAAWECAAGAICFMGVCRKACQQSVPNCNAEVAACGAGEACIAGASSFSDVCYPAEAGLHELCGPANGKQCLPGHLCVEVDGEPARCLRLCQHGCPTTPTTQCEQTGNGCPVCIPYW